MRGIMRCHTIPSIIRISIVSRRISTLRIRQPRMNKRTFIQLGLPQPVKAAEAVFDFFCEVGGLSLQRLFGYTFWRPELSLRQCLSRLRG